MKNVVILGATGSIGRQALDVIARDPDEYRVVGLSAFGNEKLLLRQAASFRNKPKTVLAKEAGLNGLLDLCRLSEADTVINALVGSIGLRPSITALNAGKHLLLANKESLVAGGDLVTAAAGRVKLPIIPIDSEHSAVFQCLKNEREADVARIVLTASGGPFFGRRRQELLNVTVEDALAHPRWTMGPKITVDSATMMNKGLEVIEAHYLFGQPYDRIDVVIHPQSIVHSMVEFVDGSVLAQLGPTDMRLPIQYALTYPERKPTPVGFADLVEISRLTFAKPDWQTFPCLTYAYEAGRAGGTAPAILSAANEATVAAFLKGEIRFNDIASIISEVMAAVKTAKADTVEAIEEAEKAAKIKAESIIRSLSGS